MSLADRYGYGLFTMKNEPIETSTVTVRELILIAESHFGSTLFLEVVNHHGMFLWDKMDFKKDLKANRVYIIRKISEHNYGCCG